MTQTYLSKEMAGASTIGSLLAIIIVGAVGAVLYYALDKSMPFFTGLSADASNTIWFLLIGFTACFILFLIALVINAWINEKSDANQGV